MRNIEDRLRMIKEEDPDAVDRAMLEEAEKENDGTTIELEEYKRTLEFNGKFVIRIPKELHYKLSQKAKDNG